MILKRPWSNPLKTDTLSLSDRSARAPLLGALCPGLRCARRRAARGVPGRARTTRRARSRPRSPAGPGSSPRHVAPDAYPGSDHRLHRSAPWPGRRPRRPRFRAHCRGPPSRRTPPVTALRSRSPRCRLQHGSAVRRDGARTNLRAHQPRDPWRPSTPGGRTPSIRGAAPACDSPRRPPHAQFRGEVVRPSLPAVSCRRDGGADGSGAGARPPVRAVSDALR